MKENSQTGNEITNQWLKFWAESSTLAWKNWLVLMGLTSNASDTQESSQDFKPNHLSEPENEISEYEPGINSTEPLKEIQLLKQQLSLKDSQIAALNNKITTTEAAIAEKSKYYSFLEQEHRQQSQTIEQLKDKIAQLENHPLTEPNNFEGDSSVVLAQIKSLHQELSTKEYLITQLNAQIATSEGKIEEKAKNYLLLEQENRQKTEIIEQLQAKIANLETVAVIGERQLNKWRSRTFFS